MAGEAPSGAPSGLFERSSRRIRSEDIPWPVRIRNLAIWVLAVALSIVVLVVRFPLGGQVLLRVGDVATADVVAPRQATYVSELLTQQRRDLAANAVPDVYDPPQARIGRQQLTLANQVLDFVATVRSDSYADLPTKAGYLKAIANVDLSPEVTNRILTLAGPAWDRVAGEVQVVLERAMREEIRENDLPDERRKVAAWVRLDLSDEDAAIVTKIVQDLLAPNSFINADRTEQRRQQARDGVNPVTATIERNEIILRAGDIATALDLEALEALGLRHRVWSWEDVRSAAGFVLFLSVVLLYYVWRQEALLWLSRTEPILLAGLSVLFLIAAKAAIPAHTVLPYLFPYAALAMLLTILLNLRVALVITALFVLVVGWLTGGSLELMAYALGGSVVGALKLRRGERLADFAWAAVFVVAMNLLVLVLFRFSAGHMDLRGAAELVSAAVANGLIAMTITLVGVYLIGALFGLTTPLQLLEISRPTHPLLRQLLLKAPGTYHHTLIVSNMAERAAEAIGADALLSRVGAYYHDVGKTIRPYFFVENRIEGVDPHARLDPYTSAQIIINHVKDGMDLARKYRVPERVAAFIPEHHGTLLVSYFYSQAVKQAGSAENVDSRQFQYPGPKPQSLETAITMLADGAEATVRSKRPVSIEEIEQLVAESVQNRVLAGQLNESSLTLEDLQDIQRAFVDVLRGLHHPRIAYPSEASLERSLSMPLQEASPARTGQEKVQPGGSRSLRPRDAALYSSAVPVPSWSPNPDRVLASGTKAGETPGFGSASDPRGSQVQASQDGAQSPLDASPASSGRDAAQGSRDGNQDVTQVF